MTTPVKDQPKQQRTSRISVAVVDIARKQYRGEASCEILMRGQPIKQKVGRPGLEPGTYGLKVRSSAIELATQRGWVKTEPILSTQAYLVRVGGFGTHPVHFAEFYPSKVPTHLRRWVIALENSLGKRQVAPFTLNHQLHEWGAKFLDSPR